MLEAGRRHERCAGSLALEQRIRRRGRPVREPLDRRGSDGAAAASTDSSWRAAVGTLAVDTRPSSTRTASVNVPPTSTPRMPTARMYAVVPALKGEMAGTDDGDRAPRRGRGAGRLPPHDRIPRRRRPAAEPDRRGGVDARADAAARREPARRRFSSPRAARGTPRSKVSPAARSAARPAPAAAHVLRLDEDLSPFYAAAAGRSGAELGDEGAGRMIRSPTVFEEVVKTICTTNCTWSATVRMVSSLVEELGEPGPGGGRAVRPRLPDARGHGPQEQCVLHRQSQSGLSRRVPPEPGPLGRVGKARPRGARHGRARTSCPTTSSLRGCSRSPVSGRTRRRTS